MNHKAEPTPSVKASDANLRRNHEWFHSSVGLECRLVTSETGDSNPIGIVNICSLSSAGRAGGCVVIV